MSNHKHHILLVDDDVLYLESIREYLTKREFIVEIAKSGYEAISKIEAEPKRFSVVVLDFDMPGMNGGETTQALKKINPDLFILILSGFFTPESVLYPQRKGAQEFVGKNEPVEKFLRRIKVLCKKYEEEFVTVDEGFSKKDISKIIGEMGIVGCSKALAKIAVEVGKLRENKSSVLLLGESGVGKEEIAKALHKDGPFETVNCADVQSNSQMLRSEFFGHLKGSFTGADSEKKGVFAAAGGGTLLLDEIDTLSLDAQTTLYRAVDKKLIRPVGSDHEIEVDVRIVSTAKPDLLSAVGKGTFKLDLFYRLTQSVITVPPLRERPEDIGPLVDLFSRQWSEREGKVKKFLASSIPYLERYPWPGNVRELSNIVNSILYTTNKTKIGPKDLDRKFRELMDSNNESTFDLKSIRQRHENEEKAFVLKVLGLSRSSRDAAKRLGVCNATVFNLLNKYGIDASDAIGVDRVDRKAG